MIKVGLIDYLDLAEREAKYLNSHINMTNHYLRVNHTLKLILHNYKLNIKEKFTLFEDVFMDVNSKTGKEELERFLLAINEYQVVFMDFKMQTYLSNMEKVFEPYFPLTKIISYRSQLELKLVKKISPRNCGRNQRDTQEKA